MVSVMRDTFASMCQEIADRVGHYWYEGDLLQNWTLRSPRYAICATYDSTDAMFHVYLRLRRNKDLELK
jgi:hypothetical protein